jgi:transposase
MSAGNCTDCKVRWDLHWEVQYRKALHARAAERASRWREQAHALRQQVRSQAAENKRLSGQLEAAKARLAWMQQQLFGRKTERTESLPAESGEAQGPADSSSTHRRSRGKQPGTRGNGRKRRTRLRIEEVPHDLPEEHKCCPLCGKPLEPFPGTEDSEEIDWEVRLVRRVHKRKRYRPTCRCRAVPGIVTAPGPPKLIPKGMFSCGFWVELVLNKYLHGMPVYRVRKALEMENLEVSQGTLTGGLKKIGELLEPLYGRILERSQQARHWHMDETGWWVFVDVDGKANHRWWLWVIGAAETCSYIIDPSRSSRVPREHLGDHAQGIVSSDRFSAYKILPKRFPIAYCWAHVRRDFLRIRNGHEQLARWTNWWLERINELFRINRTRRAVQPGSDSYLQADGLLRDLLRRMKQRAGRQLNGSGLHPAQRKVLISLRKHWQGLTIFVDHPEIPMDNNLAERQLRFAVVGRKNYYGNGATWSARLTAALFTILQTLLRNNIHPKRWLRAYFEACARNGGRAPDNFDEFLPWNLPEQTRIEWQYEVRPP